MGRRSVANNNGLPIHKHTTARVCVLGQQSSFHGRLLTKQNVHIRQWDALNYLLMGIYGCQACFRCMFHKSYKNRKSINVTIDDGDMDEKVVVKMVYAIISRIDSYVMLSLSSIFIPNKLLQ